MEVEVINRSTIPPDISVIVPARNAADALETALDSVARQSLCVEIIFVDDASTDSTRERAKNWAYDHTSCPFSLISLKKHHYALRTRLAGLKFAAAEDVMFLDADDKWMGSRRLAHALSKKREMNCEITHFRTTGVLNGKDLGEFLWTAPPPFEYLQGREIFAAYAQMEYISLQLWNKIYSRDLIIKASKFVGDTEIFYFDDKFFTSIILMCANSWNSVNEYIYQYKPNIGTSLEQAAQRAHDLIEILNKAKELFSAFTIDAASSKDYMAFITRRYIYYLGVLSIEAEKQLSNGRPAQDLLSAISPWLSLPKILPYLVNSTYRNTRRILEITQRIYEKY